MARLVAGASFVVGVDTGILHLAAALGVPLTAIFTGSEPGLTGPVGPGKIEIVGAQSCAPVGRRCRRGRSTSQRRLKLTAFEAFASAACASAIKRAAGISRMHR